MMRITVLFIFVFFSKFTHAVNIADININCADEVNCANLSRTFNSLKREYTDFDHISDTIKLYVANEGVKSLSYSIEEIDGRFVLNLVIDQKQRVMDVDDIEFVGGGYIDFPTLLPLRRDDYLDKIKISQTINLISEIARDKGFPNVDVNPIITNVTGGVNVKFKVHLNEPILISKINITSNSAFLKNILWTMLGEYNGLPYDAQKIKNDMEEARKLFMQYGYYLAEVDMKTKHLNANDVVLFINVKNTRSYVFQTSGLKTLAPEVIKKYLANTLIGFKREMSEENVSQSLREKFEEEGFKESEISISKKKYDLPGKEIAIHYNIKAYEGVKVRINKVEFKGTSFYTNKELVSLFYEKAGSLASAKVHDEKYYEDFTKQLRELFIEKGFVSVYVEKPLVKYDKISKKVNVTYRIREGVRTQIHEVNILGIPDDLKKKVVELMHNRTGSYFNPITFESDLSVIIDFLKNEGYYFARLNNLNSNNLVQYKQDNFQVDINLDITTGLKLYTGDVIIIGNNKTRKLLIERELQLESGDLITIEKIQKSQVALLSLGIFSSVQIQPVSSDKSKTDVLVFVREKDFGSIEIAPGIRSDVGLKISTLVNYSNIDGMNKRITFKGSVNKRLDFNTLDPERRKTVRSLIEYDTAINYSENHLFHTDFDFNTQISKSRKRFYSFDADIQRMTFRISKDFTKWFNSSVKYQFETISQFNATVEREHGHFQIGSVTPAVTFDFRDRTVNPTKGASFNLSCEFANPALLSQQSDELTINYYKLMNRNRFYFPLGRDVTLAISTSVGIQENLARNKNSDGTTEGYIPNIKVFRLSGADIVRGFEDDEINRLITKQDISQYEVNNRAYMANFKFEPRLMLSDSTVLGIFYDAGRIFVNEVDMQELRSSVGASFKYLTPVGTLDFSYGIKLLRKKDANGTLDSPGRLHVSIGFF